MAEGSEALGEAFVKGMVCCGLESESVVLASLFVFLSEGCKSSW